MITFPVTIRYEDNYRSCVSATSKIVEDIHLNWFSLKESVPHDSDSYGIRTGGRSGITVIDHRSCGYTDLLRENTLQIRTPSGGIHIYFRYQPKLRNIYNTLPDISVINNRGCVFRGSKYKVLKDLPIADMPESMVNMLAGAQDSREKLINRKYLELAEIISKHLNCDKTVMDVIWAFRNARDMLEPFKVYTLKLLLRRHRSNYHDGIFDELYNKQVSSDQKRYRMSSLEKAIASGYPEQYAEWKKTWKQGGTKAITTTSLHPRFEFSENSIVKLSELKAIDRSITAKKIIEHDNRYIMLKKHICLYCKALHRKGCCSQYDRTKTSSAMYISNIAIKPE